MFRTDTAPQKTDAVAGRYEETYRGCGLTADEVWEEVVCGSLGDMNFFHDIPALEDNAKEFLGETRAASVEDPEASRTRGPPTIRNSQRQNITRTFSRTELRRI